MKTTKTAKEAIIAITLLAYMRAKIFMRKLFRMDPARFDSRGRDRSKKQGPA